jgi:adenine/guanine phosphoribosyltransferase-like PRPP-binding protein
VVGQLGAEVTGVAVIIELGFLAGRTQLTDVEVFSIVTYD